MIICLLRLASFFVFFGRGYQHIFFDAPYRAFLWDESLLKTLVTSLFNTSWHAYVTSPFVDTCIQGSIIATGGFYFLCAVLSLFIKKEQRFTHGVLRIGCLFLFLLSLLYFKEHFFQIGHLLETTLQWSTPLFLSFYIKNNGFNPRVLKNLKLAFGLTFLGHGLYAIGFHAVPGHFLDMIRIVFSFSESSSLFFLKIIGHVDILVFLLIIFKRWEQYAFYFALVWGLLTSFARITTALFLDFSFLSLHHYFYETFYRLPHFFIPLVLLYILRTKGNKSSVDQVEIALRVN